MNSTHQRVAECVRSYLGLMALAAVAFTVFYVPQPIFNTISAEFGVDKSAANMLVGVFMLSFAFSPLFAGMVLSKIGSRRTILVTALLMGASGAAVLFVSDFSGLLLTRCLQALLMPTLITGVLASTAGLLRHLDLKRAMAGYVFAALFGATVGRVLGGVCAQFFGWRLTMGGACFLVLAALPFVAKVPETMHKAAERHSLKEYLGILKVKGVGALAYVDACGIFAFAAAGNLLAYRVAELGYPNSEAIVGLMYTGYAVGLVTSMLTGPLLRLFKKAIRMLIAGSLVYMAAISFLAVPSIWILFATIWFLSLGQFMIHALVPGIVNRLAEAKGCDRGMVNGLYLSCYYMGGVFASFVPGLVYTHIGWTACCGCMLLAQLSSFFVLLFVKKSVRAID